MTGGSRSSDSDIWATRSRRSSPPAKRASASPPFRPVAGGDRPSVAGHRRAGRRRHGAHARRQPGCNIARDRGTGRGRAQQTAQRVADFGIRAILNSRRSPLRSARAGHRPKHRSRGRDVDLHASARASAGMTARNADRLHRAFPPHRAGRSARTSRVSARRAWPKRSSRCATTKPCAKRHAADVRPAGDLCRARRLREPASPNQIVSRELPSRHDGLRIESYLYTLLGHQAVEHLFRVCTGLDSMLIGEAEILGQVKDAYVQAHAREIAGTNAAPPLSRGARRRQNGARADAHRRRVGLDRDRRGRSGEGAARHARGKNRRS